MKIDVAQLVATVLPILIGLFGRDRLKRKADDTERRVREIARLLARSMARQLRDKVVAGKPIQWWLDELDDALEAAGIKPTDRLRQIAARVAHDVIDEFSDRDIEGAAAQLKYAATEFEAHLKAMDAKYPRFASKATRK